MKRTRTRQLVRRNNFQAGFMCGFTLVELLVVIGIIAVLIGILLPTLGRARQAASKVKCMANLRSIGQAMFMYTGQFKDSLPVGLVNSGQAVDKAIDPSGTYTGDSTDWSQLLSAIMSRQASQVYDHTNTSTNTDVTTGQPAYRAVFVCPDCVVDSTAVGPILEYSAHPRLIPSLGDADRYAKVVTGVGGHLLVGYKISKVRHPAEILLVADGSCSDKGFLAHATMNGIDGARLTSANGPWLTDDAKYFPTSNFSLSDPVDMAPVQTPGVYTDANLDDFNNSGNIRFRHMGNTMANVLMVDGHVQSFSYKKSDHSTDLTRSYICVGPNR